MKNVLAAASKHSTVADRADRSNAMFERDGGGHLDGTAGRFTRSKKQPIIRADMQAGRDVTTCRSSSASMHAVHQALSHLLKSV